MRLDIAIETTPKKAFATAIDWPGLARSGRTTDVALEALRAALPRYAGMLGRVNRDLEPPAASMGPDRAFLAADIGLRVVEDEPGSAGTDFGVPSRITAADRRSIDEAEAIRRAAIVAASWAEFHAVVAVATQELRKGPRGGGRDRDKIVAHVTESDHAYARELGIRMKAPRPDDQAAIEAMRTAMLEILRRPSDGGPLAARTWTTRYAAHRIAWHALDHAWEIEDRTEPATS